MQSSRIRSDDSQHCAGLPSGYRRTVRRILNAPYITIRQVCPLSHERLDVPKVDQPLIETGRDNQTFGVRLVQGTVNESGSDSGDQRRFAVTTCNTQRTVARRGTEPS